MNPLERIATLEKEIENLQRKMGLLENEIRAARDMNAHRLQLMLDIAADLAKEIAEASR